MTVSRTPLFMSARTFFAVGILYFGVIPFQRQLVLVAAENLKFYDGVDRANAIFQLSKGDSAIIVECRDTESVIEPVIQLSDGRLAYPLSGDFKINVKPTGLLSRRVI